MHIRRLRLFTLYTIQTPRNRSLIRVPNRTPKFLNRNLELFDPLL
jgi:hypothetical protein